MWVLPHFCHTLRQWAELSLSWQHTKIHHVKSCCWSFFMSHYSPLSSWLADLHVILNEWLAFHSSFLNIHWSGVLTVLLGCYMAGAMWNCCLLGMFCVYHTTMHHVNHFMQSHVRRVHVCLAVTCHLHFWQNGCDLLHATVVTWGWNRYRDEWAQKVDPGEDNSPTAPARTQTHNLSILSPAL